MITLLAALYEFLTSKWSPISVVITAGLVMYTNILGILEKIQSLITYLDTQVFPNISAGTSAVSVSPFTFLNYVLPLDLAIAMFTLWLPFMITCSSYRLIKSHVPTIS